MNSSSQASPPVVFQIPHIGEIAGPLLLGAAFNACLLGVLTIQVYLYAIAFAGDSKRIKTIVYTVYALEALQAILIAIEAFQKFVVAFSNPLELLMVHTLWLSIPVLTGSVTFLCQGLFAYRIWILARDRVMKVVFYFIIVSCFIQLAMSLIIGVSVKNAGRLDIYEATLNYKVTNCIWYASSSLGDALIAMCMIFLLARVKATTIDECPTRNFLEKVVRLTVGTNSMTAAVAILTLVMVISPVNPSDYQASLATLGKMYSNSMMVLLNNRMRISSDENKLDLRHGNRRSSERHPVSELRFHCAPTESHSTMESV